MPKFEIPKPSFPEPPREKDEPIPSIPSQDAKLKRSIEEIIALSKTKVERTGTNQFRVSRQGISVAIDLNPAAPLNSGSTDFL